MANLSQIELHNLKHFIQSANSSNIKLTAYANAVSNSQIKQIFNKIAQDSLNEKETLMTFLNN